MDFGLVSSSSTLNKNTSGFIVNYTPGNENGIDDDNCCTASLIMSTSLFSFPRAAAAVRFLTSPLLRPLRGRRPYHREIPQKYFVPLRPETPAKELFDAQSEILMPPYPYGPNYKYPDADRGLYGGATVQSGNKISKGRNKGKTRRRWYPNVRMETIRSEALDRELTIRITARCMRTIRKCGGLDGYLLGDKPARIKELGLFGWRLRWKILHTPKVQAELAQERERLGLPPRESADDDGDSSFAAAWTNPATRRALLLEQKRAWDQLREKSQRFETVVKTFWNPADHKEHEIKEMVTLNQVSPETVRIPDELLHQLKPLTPVVR